MTFLSLEKKQCKLGLQCDVRPGWRNTGMLAGFFYAADSFALLRRLFKEVFVDSEPRYSLSENVQHKYMNNVKGKCREKKT